jgi:hypothetical protein
MIKLSSASAPDKVVPKTIKGFLAFNLGLENEFRLRWIALVLPMHLDNHVAGSKRRFIPAST